MKKRLEYARRLRSNVRHNCVQSSFNNILFTHVYICVGYPLLSIFNFSNKSLFIQSVYKIYILKTAFKMVSGAVKPSNTINKGY